MKKETLHGYELSLEVNWRDEDIIDRGTPDMTVQHISCTVAGIQLDDLTCERIRHAEQTFINKLQAENDLKEIQDAEEYYQLSKSI